MRECNLARVVLERLVATHGSGIVLSGEHKVVLCRTPFS